MKKTTISFLATVFIVTLSFNKVNAQKMSEPQNVNASVVVMKPANEVWNELSKINGVEKIAPMITESHIMGTGKAEEGCTRSCKTSDGNTLEEKIVKLDNKNMTYTYEIVKGMPAKMTNSFKVIPLGDKACKVIWNSNYSYMENPMMKKDEFFVLVNMTGQALMDGTKANFSK
ncbi:MAG: SRPBCC family protein [Bacteroidota bacterium]|nr:SRPBCC family protein [Bacteroidota bacterium]